MRLFDAVSVCEFDCSSMIFPNVFLIMWLQQPNLWGFAVCYGNGMSHLSYLLMRNVFNFDPDEDLFVANADSVYSVFYAFNQYQLH